MNKKICLILLLLIVPFIAACENNDDTDENPSKTEGIYYVYNADGTAIMETNSIWTAIIKARDNSKSSNKCYVLDYNDETIYRYTSKAYYMYQGETYKGSADTEQEAIRWASKYSDSYVINGIATEFVYVGKELITDDTTLNAETVRGIELMSGAYVYMFSEKYNSEICNGVGYSYIEYKVEFSKAKLKYFTDTSNENGWNAYIFTNIMCDSPYSNCDMGIIQGWESDKGKWAPVFNYNGNLYSPDSTVVITQMVYNIEDDTYYGVDDLYFKCYVDGNKYCLSITNLTTNVEYYYECVNDNLVGNADKSYILLAASNCPVSKGGNFWNPRCGNSFENIIFRDVKVAKYSNDFDYENAPKYDYYPDSDACSYTLVMGGDNADCKYGTDEDGKYIIMNMYNN